MGLAVWLARLQTTTGSKSLLDNEKPISRPLNLDSSKAKEAPQTKVSPQTKKADRPKTK